MNKLISFFRRKILRIPADRWDYQYGRGQWDGLEKENLRFDEVIRIIREEYKQPAILEIGCGKALMLNRMNKDDYSAFTGVDLSEVAIDYAKNFETASVQFIAADMQTFTPTQQYDVIAFNESLYYAKDPAAVFARYIPYLNKEGSVIVTAFDNKYTAHLWPALDTRWQPTKTHKVSADDQNWNIRVYHP